MVFVQRVSKLDFYYELHKPLIKVHTNIYLEHLLIVHMFLQFSKNIEYIKAF